MKFNKNKAFTLIEMLVVVVIIGIILVIAIPSVSKLLNNRNRQLYDTHIKLLEKEVGLYVDKNKGELSNRNYSCFNINYKTLISEEFKETDIKCEGSVIVTKSNNDYNNNYYLTCYDNDNNIIVESDELPSGCSGFNDKFKMDYKIYTDSSKTTVYDESNYTKNAYIEFFSNSPYATSISHYEYSLNLDDDWKKINSGTNLQDIEDIKNFSGNIYLRSVDNVGNTSDMSTVKVKLDNTGPKVEFAGYHEQGHNYLYIKFNVSDSLSGPDTYTKYSLKYSTTNGSYTNTVDSSLYNEYWPIENLTANTTYYYQFCAYDIVGNETCITGNLQTKKTCEYAAGDVVGTFDYSGKPEEFTVPCDGTYKLEVYGAQGGTAINLAGTLGNSGGYGGYSYGNKTLTSGEKLYIVVGGQGGKATTGWNLTTNLISVSGGYNGGGKGSTTYSNNYYQTAAGGGGGATHIALGTTNRGVLANYASYKSEVLIVAGGGSGAYIQPITNYEQSLSGAAGGGTSGANGQTSGGTQESGYAFGQGQDGYQTYTSYRTTGSGSGGGYYGGYSQQASGATTGGGGSGYIGGVTGGSTTSGQRSGNGYARITLVSYEQ